MLKRPKNRKFEYVPRFYDAQKEELEERLAPYREGVNKEEAAKARIKNSFRSKTGRDQKEINRQGRSANFRLIIIIGILVLLSYMMLQSDYLARVLDAMGI